FQHFGEALRKGIDGGPGAEQALDALATDREQPSIARATALSLLAAFAPTPTDAAVHSGAKDYSPLVRRATVHALSSSDVGEAIGTWGSLLSDPVRAVRIESAEVLSRVPADRL